MNRVTKIFQEKEKVMIGYLTAGYPTPQKFLEWVETTLKSGFDVLEIGFPFSDPVADGPTIEKASREVLKNGFTSSDYLKLIEKIRSKFPEAPLVTMSYYNPLAKAGEKYFNRLKEKGIDGIIIPDLPLIEGRNLYRKLNKIGFITPMLIPPTIDGEYLRKLIEASSGFIYAVSRSGTTGERKDIPIEGVALLKRLKSLTKKPVAIGFGIKSSEQVKPLKGLVEGIIIGSALINKLDQNKDIKQWLDEIKRGIC